MHFGNPCLKRLALAILSSVSVFASCVNGHAKENRSREELHAFYVVNRRVSDAAPFWFHYILDVKPQEKDCVVQYIRIAPAGPLCIDLVTVKAVERRLINCPVRRLTGNIDLCSIHEQDVDQAVVKARAKVLRSIFETQNFGIVATCGTSEKLFKLPYPEEIELELVKKQAPRVAALYDLNYQVYERVFGDESFFYDISLERDAHLQRLGQTLISGLRSGIYDRGFWEEPRRDGRPPDSHPLRSILENYQGPVSEPETPTGVLLNRERFRFVRYVVPEYPPLAKMARIQGKVEIEMTVDASSGMVKDMRAISGHPLFQKAAIEAARKWQFDPATEKLDEPVSAVVDFVLKCSVHPLR